jgi:hypothetical protein
MRLRVTTLALVVTLCLGLTVSLSGNVRAAPAKQEFELLKALTVELAWANTRGQYERAWQLLQLHPRYQRVTSRAFWESCQRKRARAQAGVKWISIKGTNVYPDRITLPLLGSTQVAAVSVEAKIEYLGKRRTVRDTFHWAQGDIGSNGRWDCNGLWDPETYLAYKAQRCPAWPVSPTRF